MIFERFLPTKKDYQLWTSATYFSLTDQLDQPDLNQSLTWDLVSFLHEYVGMKDKKVYPYGPHGIMDAYHQKTSEICARQEVFLTEQGLDPTRAQLETKTARVVENWMADEKTAIGQKLAVISPRGTPQEGYPGLEKKHYVFINVYEKIGEDEFQLIQYTSYAPEPELKKLQVELQKLGGEKYAPNLDQPAPQPKSLSHQIIDLPLKLSAHLTYQELETLIYRQEKKWVTTRQQLPKVPEDTFGQEVERVTTLLLTQFWLLAETSPVSAVLKFDELIKVVREHFLKWVEHHAANYHQDQELAPYALNLDLILETWQLNLKKKTQALDKAEEEKLKQIKKAVALNPLMPLLRASSVAHCIVGTPGSLAMQVLRLNPGALSIVSPEIINLSPTEKKSLLEKIKSEQMTEITLSNGETWMVPQSFLTGKGCYVSAEGIAMGPCDIPLIDSFAFKMTFGEFNEFVAGLEKQAYEQELDQVSQEITGKFEANDPESQKIKDRIAYIKKLIFKPVVSITELISGDVVKSFHHNVEIAQIISKLKTSSNPLQVCEAIIKKLLEDQNGVLGWSEV